MKILFDTETLLLTIDNKVLRLVDDGKGFYFIHGLLNTEELDTLGGSSASFLLPTLVDLVKASKIATEDTGSYAVSGSENAWSVLDFGTVDCINEVMNL